MFEEFIGLYQAQAKILSKKMRKTDFCERFLFAALLLACLVMMGFIFFWHSVGALVSDAALIALAVSFWVHEKGNPKRIRNQGAGTTISEKLKARLKATEEILRGTNINVLIILT